MEVFVKQDVLSDIGTLVTAGVPVPGTLRFDPTVSDPMTHPQMLYRAALAQGQAACFVVSLPCFPANGAGYLMELAFFPIGIGAGPSCDVLQVVVTHNLLGVRDNPPRYEVAPYANFREAMESTVRKIKVELEVGSYPTPLQWYGMDENVFEEFVHSAKR